MTEFTRKRKNGQVKSSLDRQNGGIGQHMGTVLFDEPPLVISPTLACMVGLNESIVLQQVHYWLVNARKADERAKFQGGRWWTYNSAADWQKKNFPFWSVQTIRRLLARLENHRLLIRREEADKKAKGGCRVWYSIDYETLDLLTPPEDRDQVDYTTLSKLDIPSIQVDHTFTETTTETTSTEKNIADTPSAVSGGESPKAEQPASEPPQDEPPAKPKRKPRPKGDAVPAALMNPMKDAIAAAFGWAWDGDTPMTDEESGQIQKAARSLCKANFKPEQVPALLAFCRKRYENPGPMALATNVSKFRATLPTSGPAKSDPLKDAWKDATRDCLACGGNGVIHTVMGQGRLCDCVIHNREARHAIA